MDTAEKLGPALRYASVFGGVTLGSEVPTRHSSKAVRNRR